MEVLLQEDIARLGKRGEVVVVASGYARNYLLPRGLAAKATEVNRDLLDREQRIEERKEQLQLEELTAVARQVEAASCTVTAQASPEGHLFGSVGPEQIAEAFKAEGLDIKPAMVKLQPPIREVGVFAVIVQVTPEHKSVTRVWVVPE